MVRRWGWLRGVAGFGVVLLLLGQTGCKVGSDLTGVAAAGEGVLRRSHSRYSEETCERTYVYEVQPVDGELELCIRIVLQTGAQHWQLTDPAALQTRWEAEVTGGRPYRASHCFDAEAGVWELQMSMEDATGEYEVTWQHRLADSGN